MKHQYLLFWLANLLVLPVTSQGTSVRVTVWTTPQLDWDPVSGSADGPNVKLFENLKEVLIGFSDQVQFIPNMYINSGDDVCSKDAKGVPLEGSIKQQVCDDQCTNHGRYCARPLEDTIHKNMLGTALVTESLRRLCIWQLYGEGQGWEQEAIFFDYLTNMRVNRCGAKNFEERCAAKTAIKVNIDYSRVNKCMHESGDLDADAKNEMLELAVGKQVAKKIDELSGLPVVMVDNVILDAESLTLDALFAAVCEAIPVAEQPKDICSGDLQDTLGEDEDPNEEKAAEEELEEEIAEDLAGSEPTEATEAPTKEEAPKDAEGTAEEAPEKDVGSEAVEKDEEALTQMEDADANVVPEQPQSWDGFRPVVEVWTTPELDWDQSDGNKDGPNVRLFDNLKDLVLGFGDSIEFRPRYFIFQSKNVCIVDANGNPLTDNATATCADENCISEHRYCSAPLFDKVAGKEFVKETLRRICVWEVYGRNKDGADDVLFFDYMKNFHQGKCEATGFTNYCINQAFTQAEVDQKLIDDCISKSGGTVEDQENSLLEEIMKVEKETFMHYRLKYSDLPALIINEKPAEHSPDIALDVLFAAVCAQFEDGKKPDVCEGDLKENLGEDEPPATESPDLKETVEDAEAATNEAVAQSPAPTAAPTASPVASPTVAPSAAAATEPEPEPEQDVSQEDSPSSTSVPPHDIEAEQGSGQNVWALDEEDNARDSAREATSEPNLSAGSLETEDNKDIYELDLKIVDAAIAHLDSLKKCEVDTETLVTKLLTLGTAGDNIKHEAEAMEADIPMLMTQNCPHDEGEELLAKMEQFHRCSMFDLQELIETFPSTAVGVLMRCASAYTNMTKEEEEAGYVPEACIRTIEADSVLGRGLFGLYLYPDIACPCFEKLHDRIPECTADVWPIPINGALVKVQSCLAGQFCQAIDGQCQKNLDVLQECLPARDVNPNSINCADTFAQCADVYDNVPPMLNAAPLPDACLRVASGSRYYGSHVVERYDVFRHKCGENMEIWEGHTPVAEFKAFVTHGILGINYKSLPFVSGAAGGFMAGIIFTVVFIIVRNFLLWLSACCSRCWSRCCCCCFGRKKSARPTSKEYATVTTEADETDTEYHDE